MPYDTQEKLGLCNELNQESSRKKENFKEEVFMQWKLQGMWYWRAVHIVDMEKGKKIKLEDSWLMQIRGIGKENSAVREMLNNNLKKATWAFLNLVSSSWDAAMFILYCYGQQRICKGWLPFSVTREWVSCLSGDWIPDKMMAIKTNSGK